jgi:hypothetical protein
MSRAPTRRSTNRETRSPVVASSGCNGATTLVCLDDTQRRVVPAVLWPKNLALRRPSFAPFGGVSASRSQWPRITSFLDRTLFDYASRMKEGVSTQRLVIWMLLAAIIPVTAATQGRPNFTGTWTLDQSRTPAIREPAAHPVLLVLVLTQDDQTFTQKLGDEALIFRLDGSETINEMRSNIGLLKLKSRAKWDGNKLVLEFDGGSEGTGTQMLSLSEDGEELTIEIGGQGPTGQRNGRFVFTKR